MNLKTFFIRTYGCQMNELDSEVMTGILEKKGLKRVSKEEEADLLIFNTCAIRDLSERKVFGKIGLLARGKKKFLIGITGCIPMVKREALLKKFPYVDFILGTNNIMDLEKVIELKKSAKLDESYEQIDYSIAKRQNRLKAYVSIIRGCNKFCTYCVVPYTRGREVSREPASIIEEVKTLVGNGCKEITLLGQNVNSYHSSSFHFHDLLYELDKIEGLKRIFFLTSHPLDITNELIYAVRDLPSICEFIHFPMQSGSNRILKEMNRQYTIEEYVEKAKFIKKTIPNVRLGTDIIVGFPGEREEDFEETVTAFKTVSFSTAYIFTYSPRKKSLAFRFQDDVSKEKKGERHQFLLNMHRQILIKEAKKRIGSVEEVLIERQNKDGSLQGKTRGFENATCSGDISLIGSIRQIVLTDFKNETFIGKLNRSLYTS